MWEPRRLWWLAEPERHRARWERRPKQLEPPAQFEARARAAPLAALSATAHGPKKSKREPRETPHKRPARQTIATQAAHQRGASKCSERHASITCPENCG